EPGLSIPLAIPGSAVVHARQEPWVVPVPDAARATAFVEGHLVDAAGRPAIAGCSISVQGHGRIARPGASMAAAETDATDGRFRLGPLPPGEYVLHFVDRERFTFEVADIVLRPHATTELGPVQKPAPGTFSVELKAEGGVLRADVMVQLDGEGERAGTSGFVRVDRATLRGTRAMLPGRYRFTVYGKNFRWLRGSVEVVA